MPNPTGELLLVQPGDSYRWQGGNVIRTTYANILYGLPDVACDPPLQPGDRLRIGPYRLRVLAEEPEQASVLLVRERGLMLGYWFALQVLTGLYGGQTGVAVWAHAGGFAAGLVLGRLFCNSERLAECRNKRAPRPAY